MAKKKAEIILLKEDLKDTLKKCSICGEVLFASVKSDTEFGAYKNQTGWYYYSYCKLCFREKAKIYSNSSNKASKEYILEQIRLKREQERAEREWTLYKFTVDTTKFDDRVKKAYSKIHDRYIYIGITKNEVEARWKEHINSLRVYQHHNYFLNSIYENIRALYTEMSDDEFFNFFNSDIITFEVIKKLHKDVSEELAKIQECFEVKRLEHELRLRNKNEYKRVLRKDDYKQVDLCTTTNEMITNIEYCKSNQKLAKERKEHKKNTSEIGDIRSTN